jgi:hypothetical protein
VTHDEHVNTQYPFGKQSKVVVAVFGPSFTVM